MKILVTGTCGRVGRAIYVNLMKEHDVIGIDKIPCSTADYIGDIRDTALMDKVIHGVEIIVHTAALHAPHVGLVPESEFEEINVKATEQLVLLGIKNNIKHFIFTSTTALYGFASTPKGTAGWVNETLRPKPKSIYHKTKIDAERTLEAIAKAFTVPITVLQMSRCFPEPANLMTIYRLTRGIDARDVASAHACAVKKRLPGFRRFIISGKTPFIPQCCDDLYSNAENAINKYASDLSRIFTERGWLLPKSLDRVYDSTLAQRDLDWIPKYGYQSVLEMLDNEISEVLPVKNNS